MSDIYDLAILGGGPAGITAAIYASRARLNTIWIDKNFAPGGQITATYEVDNYPGMPGISGMDLGEAFGEHARKLGLEPKREKIPWKIFQEISRRYTQKRTNIRPELLSLHLAQSTGNWTFREKMTWEDLEFPIVQPVTELFIKTEQPW